MAKTGSVKAGIYKHYKGNAYSVFVTATHTESDEQLVVYASCDGGSDLWARPVIHFLEKVRFNGSEIQRFTFVRPFRPDE